MDAGVADTINRRDVAMLVARFEALDDVWGLRPWPYGSIAETLLSDDDSTRSDRAWLFASLVANIPGIRFDGSPADGDWDNLFGHLRTAILDGRTRHENPASDGASPPNVVV